MAPLWIPRGTSACEGQSGPGEAPRGAPVQLERKGRPRGPGDGVCALPPGQTDAAALQPPPTPSLRGVHSYRRTSPSDI